MKMKLLFGVIVMMLSLNACATAPISHFSVQVNDEDGKPVEGAMVKAGFTTLMLDYEPGPATQGITDEEGKLNLYGPAYFSVRVMVNKDGYYKSEKKVPVNQKKDQSVSILLRPKRNPIAMYAKQVKLVIPERGREYGFDFLKGNFVLAGHDGSQADIKIKFDRDLIDENNFTQAVSLSFNNPTDGAVEMKTNKEWEISDLKTPYYAPLEGYESSIELTYTRSTSGVKKENVEVPFFIRIRSSEDKDGNIEKAYYCKISSGVSLFGVLADKPSLKMIYYCNPTINDRNIEFDPSQNLLKNLKRLEKVSEP